MDDKPLDCLVIGGGPAGLTAAIYSSRYPPRHHGRRRRQGPRRDWIPCTHNHAGFPDGITGKELIERMKEQAQRYGARIVDGQVTGIERDEESGLFDSRMGLGARHRADRPARHRSHQPPPADGRGAARRCAGPRPDPLLPDLRRL